MGLFSDIKKGLSGSSESRSETRNTLPPPTPEELKALGIDLDFLQQQLSAYKQSIGTAGAGNQYLDQLYEEQLGSGLDPAKVKQAQDACNARHPGNIGAASQCFDALKSAAIQQKRFGEDQARQGRIDEAQTAQSRISEQALLEAQQGVRPLSPEEVALIGQQADLTIGSGLSDLDRFRGEGLDAIRMNSATRGLRPGDTPITNKYHDLATDAQRTATNFVSGIRGQQLQAQLTLPYQQAQLRQQGLGLAGDLAMKRAALEEQLRSTAQAQRLGLAGNVAQQGFGLGTAFNPNTLFGQLSGLRGASATQTGVNTPSFLDTLGRIASGVSGFASGDFTGVRDPGAVSSGGGGGGGGGGFAEGIGAIGSLIFGA